MENASYGPIAVVIGATGGIGKALAARLAGDPAHDRIVALSRASAPPLDVTAEESVADAAAWIGALPGDVRLVVNAAGFLHDDRFGPEKSMRWIDPAHMAQAFAVNAIGAALVLKHFAPLLPRTGRAVIATLSAKVGSIGDNTLGGWHSYRASKAALNQIVRTVAIELTRTRPEAICLAIHPGTVDTGLSRPFARTGLDVQTPDDAARAILDCIAGATPDETGAFLDRSGRPLPF